MNKEKGKKTIVVYTLPYCEHCQSLKGALNFMKIPYIMVDAHEDVATASQLEGKLNTKSYPIVEFPSDSIFNPSIYLTPANDKGLATAPNHRTFINIDEAAQIINSYYNEI